MHGLSWELMCVLLRTRVMCSEIAGNAISNLIMTGPDVPVCKLGTKHKQLNWLPAGDSAVVEVN